jgi:hypothetical protein
LLQSFKLPTFFATSLPSLSTTLTLHRTVAVELLWNGTYGELWLTPPLSLWPAPIGKKDIPLDALMM